MITSSDNQTFSREAGNGIFQHSWGHSGLLHQLPVGVGAVEPGRPEGRMGSRHHLRAGHAGHYLLVAGRCAAGHGAAVTKEVN